MSSTPFICCSSGEATVSAMTFGLAPGYAARTTTVGGTTCGYSLIGSLNSAMAPAATIISDRTAAKIGRSMKNLETFMTTSIRGVAWFGPAVRTRVRHRGDLHPGADPLQPVDDDALARLEAAAHDAQAVDDRTERHRPVFDLPLRRDDVDELLAQVGADRAVLNQQAAIAARTGQPQPDEQTRRQLSVGVAEHRAAANRAGGAIELVVEEVERAFARIAVLVGKRHRDVAIDGPPTPRGAAGVLQVDLLVRVEVGVDRIERHDRRQ